MRGILGILVFIRASIRGSQTAQFNMPGHRTGSNSIDIGGEVQGMLVLLMSWMCRTGGMDASVLDYVYDMWIKPVFSE